MMQLRFFWQATKLWQVGGCQAIHSSGRLISVDDTHYYNKRPVHNHLLVFKKIQIEKLNSARPVVTEVRGEKFKNCYCHGLNIILQKGIEGRVII